MFLVLGGFVFVILSLIRWFEQTAFAVEHRLWDRVVLLVLVPFAVWFYPSRVAAGRPIPVPRHQPVLGMGAAPKPKREPGAEPGEDPPERATPAPSPATPTRADDGPPPGTPKEFLGIPVIPPRPKRAKASIDPEQVEKLRRKMREQGMLDGDDS